MAKGIYVGATKEETLVPFTSNPAPIIWTNSSDGKTATGANDYGNWEVVTTNGTSSYPASQAVDGNASTYWAGIASGSDTETSSLRLSLPDGVSINPTQITVQHNRCGNSSNLAKLIGYTADGEKVELGTLARHTSNKSETFTISADKYYTEFELLLYRYSNSYVTQYIYDFKIDTGTLKLPIPQNNIARKVTKAYVGVDSKLPNLVVNGDFSNGLEGWTPLYKNYLTASVFEDGYQGKCVSLETIEDKTYSYNMFINYLTNYTFIENHIYYASVYVKSDIEKQIRICTNSENNEGDRYWLIYKEFTANTSWQKISGLGTSEGNSNEGYVAVDFQGAPKNTFYVDCFELYDLTEIFGAGNEPTQEWCDANLDTVIGKGIARKVKKGYIGVNGVAQLFYENLTLTSTTVSTATMRLNSFSSGAKTLTGYISGLSNAYKPTVTWTTTASNGFVMANHYDDTAEAIAFTIFVNGSSKTTSLSNINTRLASTTYDSDTYMLIGGTSECTGTYSATILIDFGIARSFTINQKSPTGTGHTGKLTCYVSSDNSTWTTLSSGSKATNKRYCKIVLTNLEALEAYPWSYFYFSNITDWVYQ